MTKTITTEINSEMHGHSVEYILKRSLRISSSLIKKLKRQEDGILLNGVRTKVTTMVNEGDRLVINIKGQESESIVPVKMPLDILWEDEDIIIVNKPCSMPVHPSRTHKTDTLANGVMHHLGTNEKIHIITRLDRDTSGVVLIAKNQRVAAILGDDIKNGKVKKEYIAIVNGSLAPLEGTISAPIKKKEEMGIARCVSDDGKEAVTRYEVIKKTDNHSLINLFPITGRTHQLRVHMSHVGHPIYGDAMYGAPQRGERTRLHCHKITFFHPVSGKEHSATAMIPEDFNDIV